MVNITTKVVLLVDLDKNAAVLLLKIAIGRHPGITVVEHGTISHDESSRQSLLISIRSRQ
jgi:hypothetical protein